MLRIQRVEEVVIELPKYAQVVFGCRFGECKLKLGLSVGKGPLYWKAFLTFEIKWCSMEGEMIMGS